MRIALIGLWCSLAGAGACAPATTACTSKSGTPTDAGCPKVFTRSDPIIENFGARDAPYGGFLVFPQALLPDDYHEKSHHYTKSEYLVAFERKSAQRAYVLDVVESSQARFFEPDKQALAKTFSFGGQVGRVFSYREHLTARPALALYWMNPPKQRLSISAQIDPAHPLTPDDLIAFLKAMTPATGVPALIDPYPTRTPE